MAGHLPWLYVRERFTVGTAARHYVLTTLPGAVMSSVFIYSPWVRIKL